MPLFLLIQLASTSSTNERILSMPKLGRSGVEELMVLGGLLGGRTGCGGGGRREWRGEEEKRRAVNGFWWGRQNWFILQEKLNNSSFLISRLRGWEGVCSQ